MLNPGDVLTTDLRLLWASELGAKAKYGCGTHKHVECAKRSDRIAFTIFPHLKPQPPIPQCSEFVAFQTKIGELLQAGQVGAASAFTRAYLNPKSEKRL